MKKIFFALIAMSALFVLYACGGSGGSSSSGSVLRTYTISGMVMSGPSGFPGVTVNLTGGKTASTTTDASGNYSFTVANGSYTVTPVKTKYTFTSTSRTVTINNADSMGNDFDATAVSGTYTLSGTVSLSGGGSLQGVTITLSGNNSGTAATDVSGIYSFTVANGSYTVTPILPGYSFSPTSITVTVADTDSTGNNLTASSNGSFSISGTITNANPAGSSDISVCAYDIVMQGNAGCTTISSGGGAYTLTGLPGGDYRIDATQDLNSNGMMEIGETYGKYASLVTVSNSDVLGIDFAVTPVYGMYGTITNNNPATGPIVVCAYDATTLFGNCTWADGGTGMYVIPVIDGNYTISAWQDANSNFQPDSGEPYGDYTTSPPTPAVVTVSGSNVVGIDITIQ